jgi:carbonic anhydrase
VDLCSQFWQETISSERYLKCGIGSGCPSRNRNNSDTTPQRTNQSESRCRTAGDVSWKPAIRPRLTSIEHDLTILKEHTVEKQEPFAGVLSCADSRVPVELVFDQTIGHIFVTRVAGNIVTPEIVASLEYGVAVLGIKVLLVLGHSSCGAVKAAMKAESVPGQISSLYLQLHRAVEESGGNVDKAIEANTKIQAQLLRASSPVIREAVKGGTLKVESGVYDLLRLAKFP